MHAPGVHNLPQDKLEIIHMLIDHEEAICRLYRRYSFNFPAHAEFWSALAREEAGHAAYLQALKREVLAGAELMDDGRFTTQAITSSLRLLREEAEKARTQNVSPGEALAVAYDVESALIDGRFFSSFRSDEAGANRILRNLQDCTLEHASRIREAMDSYWRENLPLAA